MEGSVILEGGVRFLEGAVRVSLVGAHEASDYGSHREFLLSGFAHLYY